MGPPVSWSRVTSPVLAAARETHVSRSRTPRLAFRAGTLHARCEPRHAHSRSGVAVGSLAAVSRQKLPSAVASPLAPSDPADGYRRERPSERVDEQRDGPSLRGNRPLEGLDGVGELAVLKTRLLKHTTASSGASSPGSRNASTALGGSSSKLLSPSAQRSTKSAVVMCPTIRFGRSEKYSVDGVTSVNVRVVPSL